MNDIKSGIDTHKMIKPLQDSGFFIHIIIRQYPLN